MIKLVSLKPSFHPVAHFQTSECNFDFFPVWKSGPACDQLHVFILKQQFVPSECGEEHHRQFLVLSQADAPRPWHRCMLGRHRQSGVNHCPCSSTVCYKSSPHWSIISCGARRQYPYIGTRLYPLRRTHPGCLSGEFCCSVTTRLPATTEISARHSIKKGKKGKCGGRE